MTVVARAPLKTTTEEATKWQPVAVMMKLGGSCEKTMVAGEIELRIGAGRALLQRGFRELHPGTPCLVPVPRMRQAHGPCAALI